MMTFEEHDKDKTPRRNTRLNLRRQKHGGFPVVGVEYSGVCVSTGRMSLSSCSSNVHLHDQPKAYIIFGSWANPTSFAFSI